MSGEAFGLSDAARKCSDIVGEIVQHHLVEIALGRRIWLAIRLSDGGYDGNMYDRRADAIRHQPNEKYCAYLLVPPSGMTPRDAEIYLAFHRRAYLAGMHLTDPEAPDYIPPLTNEYAGQQNRLLRRKTGV